MSVVVDASAMVDLLVPCEDTDALIAHTEAQSLIVPSVVFVETLSAIHRQVRAGDITADDANAYVYAFSCMPLIPLDDQELVGAAWQWRNFLQLSDALYVAAAVAERVPLLTTDRRLARAVRAQVPSVAVIEI